MMDETAADLDMGKRESRRGGKRASKRGSRREATKGRSRALSDLGASMFRLGDADSRHDTIINSVLYFAEPPSRASIAERVQATLGSEWRFHSSLVRSKDGASVSWSVPEDGEPLNMDWHVVDIEIPVAIPGEPASQADVDQFIASFYGSAMEQGRPPWRVFNLTNVQGAGPHGASSGAVLFRLHHTLGDGISLVAFLSSMYDAQAPEGAREPDAEPLEAATGKRKSRRRARDLWPAVAPWATKLHELRVFAQGVFEGLLLPVLPADEACAIKLDDVNKLGPRLVATSPVVPLVHIKEIKEAVGATVNDVLVAALAGAMRRYLEARGEPVPTGQVRAACLINMRNRKEMAKIMSGQVDLGNKFNFLPIRMPLARSDPLDRLYSCKLGLDDMKRSPAPLLAFQVNLLAARLLPGAAVVKATRDLFQKMTAVFSNVPGPQSAVYFCGQKVDGMNFFANSLTGTVFGIISYNGEVQLSAVVDANLVPDPKALVDAFADEVEELHQLTRGKFRKPRQAAVNAMEDGAVLAFVLLIVALLVRALLV